MKLTEYPDLNSFLSSYFSDTDIDSDEQTARGFADSFPERALRVVAQTKVLLAQDELPVEDFGMQANRWFGDVGEARTWLENILKVLGSGQSPQAGAVLVKDSNGTPLVEGDAVQVIKDLKVKGGSSDLKRGTLIKKIHLIDDAEAIECRVDGSTLVLKTCFLKKA